MARSGNITLENNFTKGLITEYTAMNFPENAVTDTENCVYNELGAVTRRLGIDYEPNAVIAASSSTTSSTFTEFRWSSVGNLGSITFICQQIGSRIYFYSTGTDGAAALSGGLKSFNVNMVAYALPGVTQPQIAAQVCQYTTGDGFLFITHPLCEPIYVQYNEATDNISVAKITIEIRDVEGVEDNLALEQRPSTLSNLHKYNLFNQGWYGVTKTGASNEQNPLEFWDSRRVDFPSNADIFWLYKNAEGILSNTQINAVHIGNTPAPKGHYIYNAFNINRSMVSGIPGLPTKTAGNTRPSTCQWYAGRVWYAGMQANSFASTLYFSQLTEGPLQFGKCYQLNDPTSETSFDLIDTDGGTIELPLIERVITMRVIGDTLVILGSNAIYTISGTANESFKTTNYTVRYISATGVVSPLSVVEAEGALLWWNYDGLCSLTLSPDGSAAVENISKQTIQSFIDAVPANNLIYVKGAYNKREQTVRWIFSKEEDLTYEYDHILDLNLASKAFFPHQIDKTLAPRVVGLFTTFGTISVQVEEDVVDELGATVTSGGGDDVIVTRAVGRGSREVFKFTTIGLIFTGPANGFTFSELRNTDYVDWQTSDGVGVSYSSYGLSGYRIRGEMLRAFNSTPVAFVMKNIVGSSCLISGIWDYGARQSLRQELFRATVDVSNIVRRLKIRGKGKSLQIKFESVGNAPFNLVGWSTFDTGGTQP